MLKKIALTVFLMLIMGMLVFFDVNEFFIIIQQKRSTLLEIQSSYPVSFFCAYFIIYVLVTILSLPFATVLTLFSPYIFGFVQAFVLVSFASTIGASGAFVLSRYLFSDYIQKKYPDKFLKFQKNFAKDGSRYLITLRLFPFFPFFMINIFMGLTNIKLSQFFFVSYFSMIPGIIIYLNAGNEFSKISSLDEILKIEVVLALVLLSLFVLLSKYVVTKKSS